MSNIKIEGEPLKRFRIFRSDKDQRNTFELAAEYDSEVEAVAHRWRNDWHYKILENGSSVTLRELRERIWTCEFCGQSVIRRPDSALPRLCPVTVTVPAPTIWATPSAAFWCVVRPVAGSARLIV